MEMRAVSIKLAPEMLAELQRIARYRDVSPGQVIRNFVAAEILRDSRKARPPVRADEQLVAPLRARLAADLAGAAGWADLERRLKAKGFILRAAGGGLALHQHPSGQRICKASELGFSYSRLLRRFGVPFPGHAHTWLAERIFGQPDNIELTEPFSPF